MNAVLVTGGAGYIGSHTVLALLQAGYAVTVLDNFSNSSPESMHRVSALAGRTPEVVVGDVCNHDLLDQVLAERSYVAVLHFAGLKAVGESTLHPLLYYQNNVAGSVALFSAMARAGIFCLVFSSSATVYGTQAAMPISESTPACTQTSPYARSKAVVEAILVDMVNADPRWRVAALRYFNPAGAHESGTIGEDPDGVPNNLVPFICQVAVGKRQKLQVFGNDYSTADGTGVRDYIHVMDLAEGHVRALQALERRNGLQTWNLGSGVGYSVLQVIQAFEKASGQRINYEIVKRRPGDVAECWADPALAAQALGWRAARTLEQIMADAWRWQRANPSGYRADDSTFSPDGVDADLSSKPPSGGETR